MDEQRFGFTVHRARTIGRVDGRFQATGFVEPPEWSVYLPHNCDEWLISGPYFGGPSQADAIAQLERFIAEAQQALAALREGREFGDPD